jgi:hypothetical protein
MPNQPGGIMGTDVADVMAARFHPPAAAVPAMTQTREPLPECRS